MASRPAAREGHIPLRRVGGESSTYLLGCLRVFDLKETWRPEGEEVAGVFPFGGRSATTIFQSLSSFDHFPIATTFLIALPPKRMNEGMGKRHARGAVCLW